MKLIDNASGNVSQGITLTSVADKYRLSYSCQSIGSGKSYIRIYATVTGGYKTYFFPIQFLGDSSIELAIDSGASYLQFDMIGDAALTAITLEEVEDATMQYVKTQSKYWDRIKEITNSTGTLRAEAMEGLLNLTLNAFANESGTITQENGVLTFLNGSTAGNSTQAVQITGGAIRISKSKNADGSWEWSTAITGSGINADVITTGILRAITLSGVDITGSKMTTGTLIGCKLKGGELWVGTNIPDTAEPDADGLMGTFSGVRISSAGIIDGYKDGKNTYFMTHTAQGRLRLGVDMRAGQSQKMIEINSADCSVSSRNDDLTLSAEAPDGAATKIIINKDGDINLIANNGQGTVIVTGDLQVDGQLLNS